MSIRVRIRNIVGIESADITLTDKILLVAGLNGAGKTTLLQSVASAATGAWEIRGADRKKQLALVVRKGAKEGVVLLEYPGGSVRITYPDGKIEQTGKPIELGTPLGMGAVRFMSLSAEKRMAEMAKRFAMSPSRKDFDGYWRSNPVAGLDPDAKPGEAAREAIDKLWDDIDNSGWDAIAKREAGDCNIIQGQWFEVTGTRWGNAIRLEWAPVGLLRGEVYSADEARAALRMAREERDRVSGIAAVGEAKRNNLREAARHLEQHRKALAEAEEKQAALDAEIEGIVVTLERTPEPVDPRRFPACPHCGAALHAKNERGLGIVVEKAPADRLTVAEYERQAAERAALIQTSAQKRVDRDAATRDVLEYGALVRAAEAARDELADLDGVPLLPADEIAMAATGVTDAEDHLARVLKLNRAVALNEAWERQSKIRDAVAPGGIRLAVVERRTSEINAALAEIAAAAGMSEVQLDPGEAALSYDGRPYAMISESEQWRVDFVMMLLLAKEEKAKILLVDRLDLLHPQARPGVLQALAKAKVPAIVGMTARDKEAVPDLAKAGLGVSAWIGGGKLEVRE